MAIVLRGNNTSTFSSSVSVGGTITYDDVKEIDSVGIVTARSGINVTGGNINVTGGKVLIGTTNAGSNGTADDLVVANNGSATDQAGITIRGGTSGRSQIFFSDGTSGEDEYRGMLRYDHQENSMQFRTNAGERVHIVSTGEVSIGGFTPTAGAGILQISGGLRVAGSASASDTSTPYIYRTSGSDHLNFATSGVERLRIDANGRLLINTETSRVVEDSSGNGPQGKIQIEGLNSDAMLSIIAAKQADIYRSGCITLGAHRGSLGGTPTILNDNDTVGGVLFAAGDGSDMRTKTAQIISQVDGSPSANDVPGRLVFSTRASGGSLSERLRITDSGDVGINQTTPTSQSGRVLHISGDSGGQARIHLSTSASGHGVDEGHYIVSQGAESGSTAGQLAIISMENRNITFTTGSAGSNTTRLTIEHGGDLNIADGNLKVASGHGIDFSASGNVAGMSSELFDDYEVGTWTPAVSSFTTTGTVTTAGKYVKVGRQVTFGLRFRATGTIAYGVSCNISLPFTMTYGETHNGLVNMYLNSNSEAQNSNKNGNQCKLDGEGGSRFFVGSFTTTSTNQELLFGGTYIAHT